MRIKSSGFTRIELIAGIIIFSMIFIIACAGFNEMYNRANSTCIEWEDARVMDCYKIGYSTRCENYIEKRGVKYDDGSGKTE